jgi:hypothetical protein
MGIRNFLRNVGDKECEIKDDYWLSKGGIPQWNSEPTHAHIHTRPISEVHDVALSNHVWVLLN